MSQTSKIPALSFAIKEVLLNEWDPIGIANLNEAQDEYNIYIADIEKILKDGKNADELFLHLNWIELERMGLDGNNDHTMNISKRLVEIFNIIKRS